MQIKPQLSLKGIVVKWEVNVLHLIVFFVGYLGESLAHSITKSRYKAQRNKRKY